MSAKALELAARRGALGERIATQRALLAGHAGGIERFCAGGDTLLHGVDWLKQHPAAAGVAVFALVLTRPRRAWRWARRGFFLWRGWRSAQRLLATAR
ncbi:MAG: YqjK-like family protein [Betaproteobacteria bacterium]|nr:YqjK-like family protein [Betaproteobacteria bacterium]MCL2885190.1 YqjK-like family protein [Betaproteobacteria bacterium]